MKKKFYIAFSIFVAIILFIIVGSVMLNKSWTDKHNKIAESLLGFNLPPDFVTSLARNNLCYNDDCNENYGFANITIKNAKTTININNCPLKKTKEEREEFLNSLQKDNRAKRKITYETEIEINGRKAYKYNEELTYLKGIILVIDHDNQTFYYEYYSNAEDFDETKALELAKRINLKD